MTNRIFYRSVGPSQISWDPQAGHIVFATPMYNPKTTAMEMREVTITEEEWLALIKYGEEVGYDGP